MAYRPEIITRTSWDIYILVLFLKCKKKTQEVTSNLYFRFLIYVKPSWCSRDKTTIFKNTCSNWLKDNLSNPVSSPGFHHFLLLSNLRAAWWLTNRIKCTNLYLIKFVLQFEIAKHYSAAKDFIGNIMGKEHSAKSYRKIISVLIKNHIWNCKKINFK